MIPRIYHGRCTAYGSTGCVPHRSRVVPALRSGLLAMVMLCVSSLTATQLAAAQAAAAGTTALLISNAAYPEADPGARGGEKDVQLLAGTLKRFGVDAVTGLNLKKSDFKAAVAAFVDKVAPKSVALFYFQGLGIQVGHESFLIPTDVSIWTEDDVRREGVRLESIVNDVESRGASIKIVIIDAARANPFERRFRNGSSGLAGLAAPQGSLVIFSSPPNKVLPEDRAPTSLFMTELTQQLSVPDATVEDAFTQTRNKVSRISGGRQVPWIASSLIEPFTFRRPSQDAAPSTQAAAPAPQPPATQAAVPAPQRPTVQVAAPAPQPPATQAAAPAPQPPAAAPVKPPAAPAPVAREEFKPAQDVEPSQQLAAPEPPAERVARAPAIESRVPVQPVKPPAAAQEANVTRPLPKLQGPVAARTDGIADCERCPRMIAIPQGSFQMGSGLTPFDRPVHPVNFAKPFAIGRTLVTFDEWTICADEGGCKVRPEAHGASGSNPVVNISWFDAKDYTAWLSAKTGRSYRLPSEAEWEFAAHGGTQTPFAWGQAVGVAMANCSDCGGPPGPHKPMPVMSFPANGYGLYDMAGNAAEWVEDCWNISYRNAPKDGSAWESGTCTARVLRGGSFSSTSAYIKPTARFRYDADVRYFANGFRVARDLP